MRTAHRIARHSFSMVLYIVSLFESFQLMYSTGRSSPPISWVRTAPSPRSDASVCSKKGREKSGECNSGPPHRAAFTWVKAIYGTLDDLAAVCSRYPLVSSKLAKILGFKGYLPLSPTLRSKRELGQPLLSCERAKLRGRGKTENWDSP